jgi:F0F1-type ATP synthase assembly protein I
MGPKDAVYYVGLIGGLIVGTLAARQWITDHGLIQLICGVVVGVGCGYLAEQIYNNFGSGGPGSGGGGSN